MTWLEDVLARLASADSWGYHSGSTSATEPAAVAAIALLAHGRDFEAAPALNWLLSMQTAEGNLGVEATQSTPGWPSGWALLAWHAAAQSSIATPEYRAASKLTLAWILEIRGSWIERGDGVGHDTTIQGWPWVEGTHSWIEPTAMNVLALRHLGLGDHVRARDGIRLLQDRMLAHGGCNYGNTVVFGQELRPHVQPTGLSLLALAGQQDMQGRTQKAISFLERELPRQLATASLCYGLLGLAAQDHLPADAESWLAKAAQRTTSRDPASYKLALLALAALGTNCPLIPSTGEIAAR